MECQIIESPPTPHTAVVWFISVKEGIDISLQHTDWFLNAIQSCHVLSSTLIHSTRTLSAVNVVTLWGLRLRVTNVCVSRWVSRQMTVGLCGRMLAVKHQS